MGPPRRRDSEIRAAGPRRRHSEIRTVGSKASERAHAPGTSRGPIRRIWARSVLKTGRCWTSLNFRLGSANNRGENGTLRRFNGVFKGLADGSHLQHFFAASMQIFWERIEFSRGGAA
eukprot:1182415-Prorocentrum_minimum.AAC.4